MSGQHGTLLGVENQETVPESTCALTGRDREVLDFAALRWKYPGAMEAAVRDKFEWSLTEYHHVLQGLLDRPEAAAYAPMLVARLRRLREARAARRRPRGPASGHW